MDVSKILEPLNSEQREAVCSEEQAVLVLAGAGSGKTRVLVHRIAWLVTVKGVSPYQIIAVTFTNKAANEMRQRVEAILGRQTTGMWIGTFHGLAHRFLRQHGHEANLSAEFQVLDAQDQYRLIRRAMRSLQVDESRYPPRQVQWFINAKKDEGLRAPHLSGDDDPIQAQMIEIYREYETLCQRSGLVDFAELLLRFQETLRNHSELLAHYQDRFIHILVDEFQDTNAIQYAWLRLLAGERCHPFVVGDDDQSIYGWRGARIENTQHFIRDFAKAKTMRLQQNYRSTGNILAVANALITHNGGRIGKKLWTKGAKGVPIDLYAARDDYEEVRFVVDQIMQEQEHGQCYADMAILYRSNAQSRLFEERLMTQGIAYRVYGGIRFFDRAEIKDALGYLRLVNNRDDDGAFDRIVNLPPRGIGERTQALIRTTAKQQQISLWRAGQLLLGGSTLPGRANQALQKFIQLIDRLSVDMSQCVLGEQISLIIAHSGLADYYAKDKNELAEQKLENLEELVVAASHFEQHDEVDQQVVEPDHEEEKIDELAIDSRTAFLNQAVLESGEGQAGPDEEGVQLMTLHSAKGLEFSVVFLCGLEEGLFPHARSIDTGALEEERRLCYVGITRARQKLVMSYAQSRRRFQSMQYQQVSRFVREIPDDLINDVRAGFGTYHRAERSAAPFYPGQPVSHGKFGEGIVMSVEGSGEQMRIEVNFSDAGHKWLVATYANLKPA